MEKQNEKKKEALERFSGPYNCCQSVILPWARTLGWSPERLALLGAGFGGGMGRLQEACGAFTGGVMVLGAHFAHDKELCYEKVRSLGEAVKERFGSLRCRGIIDIDMSDPDQYLEARRTGLFDEVCPRVIAFVTEFLEEEARLSPR
jgi:C_GCAxxG_C_C family probable redox protein